MKNNLSSPNPYDVLVISQGASNAEITKAFALAMKLKKYSPDEIAKARKSLMNPKERIIADYLRPILPTIKRFKREDFSLLDNPAPNLKLLFEYDGLEEAISQASQISEMDKRLGAILFPSRPLQ
jgi:hypothetical protein